MNFEKGILLKKNKTLENMNFAKLDFETKITILYLR